MGTSFLAVELLDQLLRQMAWTTLLFFGVLVCSRWLGSRAPGLRHGLWGLVLLRLMLPPDLAWQWNLGRVLPMEILPLATPTPTSVHPPMAPVLTPLPTPSEPLWPLMVLLGWLVLSFALAGRFIIHRRRLRCELEEPVTDPRVLARLEAWCRHFGVKRSVQLFTGSARRSPFTLGTLRPAIFLPRPLLHPSRSVTLESVLAHELVHIHRLDDLRLLGERWLTTLFAPFPLAHLAARERARVREELCDLQVVKGGMDQRQYLRSLIEMLRLDASGASAAVPFLRPRRNHTMRLRSLLQTHQSENQTLRLMGLTLGLLLLPLLGGSFTHADAAADDEPNLPVVVKAAKAPLHPLPEARLSASFGPWKHPIDKKAVHHDGIDLVAPQGEGIRAPLAGTVLEAQVDDEDARGLFLVLDHGDGVVTRYYHLESLRVEPGQRVKRGEIVATVGNSGQSTGPHLHFEVLRENELLDPLAWLGD